MAPINRSRTPSQISGSCHRSPASKLCLGSKRNQCRRKSKLALGDFAGVQKNHTSHKHVYHRKTTPAYVAMGQGRSQVPCLKEESSLIPCIQIVKRATSSIMVPKLWPDWQATRWNEPAWDSAPSFVANPENN